MCPIRCHITIPSFLHTKDDAKKIALKDLALDGVWQALRLIVATPKYNAIAATWPTNASGHVGGGVGVGVGLGVGVGQGEGHTTPAEWCVVKPLPTLKTRSTQYSLTHSSNIRRTLTALLSYSRVCTCRYAELVAELVNTLKFKFTHRLFKQLTRLASTIYLALSSWHYLAGTI